MKEASGSSMALVVGVGLSMMVSPGGALGAPGRTFSREAWGAECRSDGIPDDLGLSNPNAVSADTWAELAAMRGQERNTQLDETRRSWTVGLDRDVLAIFRMDARPGGKSGQPGAASVVPPQTLFAWSMTNYRFRPLTTADEKVVAFARSTDGWRVAYATAETLLARASRASAALRGVVLKEMDLRTLSVVATAGVPGEVRRIELIPVTDAGFAYRINGQPGKGVPATIRAGRLEPSPDADAAAPAICTLTAAHGAEPKTTHHPVSAACQRWQADSTGKKAIPTVVLGTRSGTVEVSGTLGAGLCGLPFPVVWYGAHDDK